MQCERRIRQAMLELPYMHLRSHSFHAIALLRQMAMNAKEKDNIAYCIFTKHATCYYRNTLLEGEKKENLKK